MSNTPIITMLRRYAKTNPARFHMPGHMGRGMDLPAVLDITELDGTDSLYDSGPCVMEARRLAAEACGAADTFLLIGGASEGIHAMTVYADGRIRTARNAHRSVFSAGWMTGQDLATVTPAWDDRECLFRSEVPALAAAAAAEDWMLVTSPSYMGCVCDLEPLAGPRLLVDAAHGAHFSFSESLPDNPAPWTHLWVESAHKTLSAPTQTAWLHLGEGADEQRAAKILQAIGTSSPSWLLLAGLDHARWQAQDNRHAWDALVRRCRMMEQQISELPGMDACGREWARSLGYRDKDPTRIVIDVRGTGYSGFAAAKKLGFHGVQIEMADFYRVVLITTPYNTDEDFDRLMAALNKISGESTGQEFRVDLCPPETPPAVCSGSEAFRRDSQRVPLAEAVGRTAADAAGAYPPGVPCWLPGERITRQACDWLSHVRALGGRLFGVNEEGTEVIK